MDNPYQTKIALQHITKIRRKNNDLWMGIMKLAFATSPMAARKLVKKIQKNDKEINKWLKKL